MAFLWVVEGWWCGVLLVRRGTSGGSSWRLGVSGGGFMVTEIFFSCENFRV